MVPQGLERSGDDDADQGRGEGEAEQGPGDDEADAHVDDAPQRNEVSEGSVQEACDAEDDAGDRGDQAGGVPRADILRDAQVDQVESLQGDGAERVDAEEREEDPRGAIRELAVGRDGAHVDPGGRVGSADHLGGYGVDAAGGACRARGEEEAERAHGH